MNPAAPSAGTEDTADIHWLSEREARELFDQEACRWLGISGDEFLRRWDAGQYQGREDDPDVIGVAVLLDLVR